MIHDRQKGDTYVEVNIENNAISAHLVALRAVREEINILQTPLISITTGRVRNVKTRTSHDEMFAIDAKHLDLVALRNVNALHSKNPLVETEISLPPVPTEEENNEDHKRHSPITIGHAPNVKIPTSHSEIRATDVKQLDQGMLRSNDNPTVEEVKETVEVAPQQVATVETVEEVKETMEVTPHQVATVETVEVAFHKQGSVDTKQVALLVEMVNEVDLPVMVQLHHAPLDLGKVNHDSKAKEGQEISREETGQGMNAPYEKLDRASHVQRIVERGATPQILPIAKLVENGLDTPIINHREISENPKNSNVNMMIEGIG